MAIWHWHRDWDPAFRELRRLQREMDRLFEGWEFGRMLPARATHQHPPVNHFSTDEELVVQVELPGVGREDVDISLVGDTLTIRGERKQEQPQGAAYHRRERGAGPFARVVELSETVDPSKVQASYTNGLLTITLARAEEAKPKRIPVTSRDEA